MDIDFMEGKSVDEIIKKLVKYLDENKLFKKINPDDIQTGEKVASVEFKGFFDQDKKSGFNGAIENFQQSEKLANEVLLND